MKTIKDAVIELGGRYPSAIPEDISSQHCKLYVNSMGTYIPANDVCAHDFVCTRSEFESCAKRMGYINGYLWGKEYATNGKRPELPDDVLVDVTPARNEQKKWSADRVDNWIWDNSKLFEITDPRYKPTDEVSEIAESINKSEYVSELRDNKPFDRKVSGFVRAAANKIMDDIMNKEPIGMSEKNWHERGEFPPSGTYCQFQLTDGTGNWVNCFIIGTDDLGFCVCRADMGYLASMSASRFRPICTHREKVIEAASERVCGIVDLEHLLNELYDAGMLVLPQDSSDTKD